MILHCFFMLCCCASGILAMNDRPVIGILLQENRENDSHVADTYVMFDYIEYVHAAGALAVPIRVKESDKYYEDMFKKINGILFPGGGVSLLDSEYAKAGRKLINMAIEANNNGDYFPVWGTCLGSELLIQTAVGTKTIYKTCDAEDIHLPLNLLPHGKHSKVLRHMPEEDLYTLTHDKVTANYHTECLTPQAYDQNEDLKKFYSLISTNYDKNGIKFVSFFEARNYPIYGSQFHPEKNPYFWSPDHHVNHSSKAVKVSHYFGSFFVNEARKSGHRYPDNKTLSNDLFYNYVPVYLGYPAMFSNYYFNYTHDDTLNSFEDQYFFVFWMKDNVNTTHMLFSSVVFFFLGISFVFLMDYAIAVRRKMFVSTSSSREDYVNDQIKENLLCTAEDMKIPL